MKKIEDIIEGLEFIESNVDQDLLINQITDDSRLVKPGSLFVANKGIGGDGHDYIASAIQNGASCIVYDDEEKGKSFDIPKVRFTDVSQIKWNLAKNFYDNPSEGIKLIGITGTNGKTTVAHLTYQLLKAMGMKVGLISTIDYRIGEKVIESTHTTPDVIKLNDIISDMKESNCDYVVMEVSSHAVDQGRIKGLSYDLAVFTNLTHDHIDYHGSFKDYINAKKKFFDGLEKSAISIVNHDEKHGSIMIQNSLAQNKTYGLKKMSDYKGKILSNGISGLEMLIDDTHVFMNLVGKFNAYNLMAVYAIASELSDDKQSILTYLSGLKAAEGRFDRIENKEKGITGIIDYAHTPDALQNVLQTINDLISPNAKIITVVGCGGDRDKSKRPKMAAIAQRLSDKLILTSDNPRSEKLEAIIADMKTGLVEESRAMVVDIGDRKKAIEMAVMMAQNKDIILIAGKGHEKYQIINGEKFPFDDKQILKSLFDKI